MFQVPLPGGQAFAWGMPGDGTQDPSREPEQEQAAEREAHRLLAQLRDARLGERMAEARLHQARAEARPGPGPGARPEARADDWQRPRDRQDMLLVAHGPGGASARATPGASPNRPRADTPGQAPGQATGAHRGTLGLWRTHPLPRGMDRAACVAIERELAAAFPWLRRLPNGRDIVALYALRIAWQREVWLAHETMQALPDPARTIVSREKRARARKRAPWKERRNQALGVLRALPNHTRIRLSALRADDFTRSDSDIDSRGRRAMLAALDEHQGSVRLDLNDGLSGELAGELIRLRVFLDGAPLYVQADGLRFDAFFGTTSVALLEVQQAYYKTVAALTEQALDDYLHEHPEVMRILIATRFEAMIGAQVLARLDRERGGGMPEAQIEAQIVEEMRQDRLDRAGAIRARTAAAMVPLAVVASLFAIEGASDVFLAAFPLGRAADLVNELAALRRAGKAARAFERSPRLRQLHELLDDQQARFLRGIGKLGARQRRALLEIGEKIKSSDTLGHPDVIIALMESAARGHADLAWIAAKLRKGHFDGAFVRNYTRYDANPTWRQLKMLLANRIPPASRSSLVSKLAGFRGEEAAERLVLRRYAKNGLPVEVRRGDGSLDIVAQTRDESTAVFAEVKNWRGVGWLQEAEREKVKEQLRLHNQRIEVMLAGKAPDRQPEEIHKLLMVEESGWMLLEGRERDDFVREIRALGGWKIQVIPSSMIEDTGQFIDRLRRPASK